MRHATVLRSALLLLAGITAHAQFSGPALPSSTPVNRPLTVTTDPAILFPTHPDHLLSSADVVTVKLYGPGDYNITTRIASDGTVQLPLIGTVTLKDLSIAEAETLIEKKLVAAGMFVNPQITISVVEGPHSSATFIGEVHAVVPIVGERRLLDVLAAAGGLPVTASHIITINRPGVAQPIVVDLGTDPSGSAMANVPIFGGDTIVVSRVGVVYVIGAFHTQGAVPITQNTPLTLMQVTALTGGPTFEGKSSEFRIIRTIDGKRTMVKVDINKVLYGKAPDPVLQADDILFLPTSNMKAIIKSGGIGSVLGIASLLIAINH